MDDDNDNNYNFNLDNSSETIDPSRPWWKKAKTWLIVAGVIAVIATAVVVVYKYVLPMLSGFEPYRAWNECPEDCKKRNVAVMMDTAKPSDSLSVSELKNYAKNTWNSIITSDNKLSTSLNTF